MKKNDWILLGSVATYSYLFYNQTAGINSFVFTCIIISLLLIRNTEVLKNKSWLFAALGSIISSLCVTYYGSSLSIISTIISFGLLSGLSINLATSALLTFLFSCYSVVASFVFMIIDTVKRSQNKSETNTAKPFSVKLMLYLVPILIALVFFFMYKAANPVFDNFTKKINLDFITIEWFFFTLGGLFLMYGFFYHKTINYIANKDKNAPNTLTPELVSGNISSFSFSNIDHEKLSGIILFSMLNALLLSVNLIDVNFLWGNGALPKDLSYSAFVHQGTGAQISSIIIAILIILFYFRGALNFHEGNKWLKILACLWVIQNAFMILSTAYRNNLYINEYSLTYKRIGVYVWLLLVLIGLITTFIKIIKTKSNWFLVRVNSWLFYTVLLISCFINWDAMLTNFNIRQAEQKNRPLDVLYLTYLSEQNIPQLLRLNDTIKTGTIDETSNDRSMIYENNAGSYKPQLHYKLYNFLDEMQKHEWQSYCVQKTSIYNEIESMSNDITEINLQHNYKESLHPLASLKHIKTLNFNNNLLQDLNELQLFPELETLFLMSNSLDSINHLPKMENLKTLSFSNNRISDVSALKNTPNLQTLDLTGNPSFDLNTLPSLKKLNYLSLNTNGTNDLKPLTRLPELEELNLSGMAITSSMEIPVLPKLKKLNLQSTRFTSQDLHFLQSLENVHQLEQLNLADNSLTTLYGAITYTHIKKAAETDEQYIPLFDNLKSLNLSRNNLNSVSIVSLYPSLEELYLDGNQLKDISKLQVLTQLKTLSINSCGINTINFIKNLEQLETLDISSNSLVDYSPLYSLKNLKQLSVGVVSKQTVEQLQKALPTTKIIAIF